MNYREITMNGKRYRIIQTEPYLKVEFFSVVGWEEVRNVNTIRAIARLLREESTDE